MSIYQPEPCPPSPGGGQGSGSVAEFILCDGGNGGQRFIRKFLQDAAGAITAVRDFDLEGAAYTVVGPVTACSTSTGAEVEITNDSGNPIPVSGTLALDAATLAALETINALVSGTVEITNDAGNPIPVNGTVALDAATLAALETINAIVSGTVALDGPTLAALENITAVVSGTVALDAATLAALENITVTVSSEVEIKNDSGSPVPVTGTVTITDGSGPVTVDGTVNIGTMPEVEIKNDAGSPIPVTGTVTITDGSGPVTVDGTVNIGTMPEVEIKNDAGNPVPVTGTVTITDGSGPVTVDGTVQVGNWPASTEISNDAGNPIPVSGTVTITDGSGPVTVDGTVALDGTALASLTALLGPTSGDDVDEQFTAPQGAGAVFAGPWKDVQYHGSLVVLYAITPIAQAPASVVIEWSDDSATVIATTALIRQDVTSAGVVYAVYLSIINGGYQARYARLKVTNGAVAQTANPIVYFARNRFPFNGNYASLNEELTFFSQALLVRSVEAGVTPDGSFVNSPQTGVSAKNNTAVALAANATWQGAWELCDQYSMIGVNIRSDVGGTVLFEFSQDGVGIDRTTPFAYTNAPVGSTFAVPVQSRYVRVSYTNGGVAQTVMRLQARLLEEDLAGATLPIIEGISDQTMAQLGRAIVAGKGSDGVYRNATVTPKGSLATDPEALSTLVIGRYTIGVASSQIAVAGTVGRKTVSIKCLATNSGIIYIGTSAGVTVNNGYPLSAGESVEIDVATGVNIYAIASAANQSLATLEVAS
jgi:polyisoprenoid-binding protein YceI